MTDSIRIKVSTQELQAASGQTAGTLQEMKTAFSVIGQAVDR